MATPIYPLPCLPEADAVGPGATTAAMGPGDARRGALGARTVRATAAAAVGPEGEEGKGDWEEGGWEGEGGRDKMLCARKYQIKNQNT